MLSIGERLDAARAFDIIEAFGGGDFIDTTKLYCLNFKEGIDQNKLAEAARIRRSRKLPLEDRS